MKKNLTAAMTAITLLTVLTIPVQLAAQDNQDHNSDHKHHHYQLIDLGTFGGPNSSVPMAFLALNGETAVRDISDDGTVAALADTSTPDPLCYIDDCFFGNALQWQQDLVTNLGTLPGGQGSGTTWISGNGLIVGLAENGETDPLTGFPEIHGVIWRGNGIVDLGTEGGNQSFAFAVNNRGQVVGTAENTIPDPFSPFGTQLRAVLWQKGGIQDLGTLGGPEAVGFFVNERGQVAGYSFPNATPNSDNGPCPPNLPTQEPFFWDKHTGMIDIGNFGGTCGLANALNNRGQVAGQSYLAANTTAHAFLWDKKGHPQLRDLGTLGGDNASGEWLNDAGEVVGYADVPNPQGCTGLTCVHHGFRWKDGVMTDLGTLGSDPCSRALSINSSGQIVGLTIAVCGGNPTHGFLWEDGGPAIDLNTLVNGADMTLTTPVYINDSGEIVGNGVLPNGDTHAFVLIPCGEGDERCGASPEATTGATRVGPAPTTQSPTAANPRFRDAVNPMLHSFGRR
jgi:probable HAF family extracellular repeat protein